MIFQPLDTRYHTAQISSPTSEALGATSCEPEPKRGGVPHATCIGSGLQPVRCDRRSKDRASVIIMRLRDTAGIGQQGRNCTPASRRVSQSHDYDRSPTRVDPTSDDMSRYFIRRLPAASAITQKYKATNLDNGFQMEVNPPSW